MTAVVRCGTNEVMGSGLAKSYGGVSIVEGADGVGCSAAIIVGFVNFIYRM